MSAESQNSSSSVSGVQRSGRGLQILAISLALLNLLLWFGVPTIRAFVDDATGRSANPHNPRIGFGVQELLVYFVPWLSEWVFPSLYIFGFAAISFLKKPSRRGFDVPFAVVVAALLLAFEMIWLFLIGVEVFLRGPNWNIFWPGEDYSAWKVVIHNHSDLYQHFWLGRSVQGMPWPEREFLGIALLGSYFVTGIIAAYFLFRTERKTTPLWRWTVIVWSLQLAALIPLKMVSLWVFNIKYWIHLPEFDTLPNV